MPKMTTPGVPRPSPSDTTPKPMPTTQTAGHVVPQNIKEWVKPGMKNPQQLGRMSVNSGKSK